MSTTLAATALLVWVWVGGVQAAASQAGSGEIHGEVRDPAGRMVPGAPVTMLEIRTNQEYVARTDREGVYGISNVKPGLYRLVVEMPGFKVLVQDGIRLTTGEKIRVDAVLKIGDVSEIVMVSSDAPLVRTETGSLGQLIRSEAIESLPLNGRSFVSLAGLASGVALPAGSAFPRINGGRPRTNEYLYDGISVLLPEPGTVAFFPIIDAIQEFKIETNSPGAQFGRFNGGVVNLSTKSGTNEFHGSVFEFFRNETLNARNLFAPAGSSKPVFRRHQFGAIAGGPVSKDRTFFFADYQGTRQQVGRVSVSTVPTLLQRRGIFTEAVQGTIYTIYDPQTTQALPDGSVSRRPFAGNSIPEDRVDSTAALLLQRYPLPTSAGTANNYTRVGTDRTRQDQFDGRVDHSFTPRDRIYGRYSLVHDFTSPMTPLPDGSGSLATGAIADTLTRGQSVAATFLHSFGAGSANEFRFGYTRRMIKSGALLPSASEGLQLPNTTLNGEVSGALPTFLISGYQQLGHPANADSRSRTDLFQIVNQVSKQAGGHSLTAGIDFRWERMDIVQPPSPMGLFQFSSLFTDLPGTPSTGLPLASFLLGQVQTFSIDLQERPIRPRAHIQEYFIQDDWKATRRLTVNAGLRWTLNFPSTEVDDQGAVFDLETEELKYLGKNGFPRSSRRLHMHDLGPRLGLAYRLLDNMVLRAAYGLIWIEQAGITTPFTNPQFPFIQSVSQKTLDNITPAFILASGPSVEPIAPTPDAGLGQGVFTVDRSLGSGYAQQWNLFIQHGLGKDLAVEIGYTGSKITHLGIPETNVNQLTVGQLGQGTALLRKVPNPYIGIIPESSSLGGPEITQAQLMKPYPRFTGVSFFRNNVGNSSYHALQARAEKRFSKGFSFLASYTFSKLLDEASSVFTSSIFAGPASNYPVADSFNRRLERDVSSGDIPHDFDFSYRYILPFGPERRSGGWGMLRRILGGWEIAGVFSAQSGLPLAVTQSTNYNSFAGFGTQRPNRIGNPELPESERSTSRYFDTEAFAQAPQFTIGSASRNSVRGPGFVGCDLAVIKRSKLSERLNLEFRTEIFNLTNTAPLNSPNVVLGTPGFGSITSAGDPRVIQFALKLHY